MLFLRWYFVVQSVCSCKAHVYISFPLRSFFRNGELFSFRYIGLMLLIFLTSFQRQLSPIYIYILYLLNILDISIFLAYVCNSSQQSWRSGLVCRILFVMFDSQKQQIILTTISPLECN